MTDSTKSTPKKRPKFREWRPKFVATLAECGNITHAADMAGIDRSTAYRARERNSRFAAEWDEAMEEATDALEKEARRRAVEGVSEPIFYQGQEVGTVQRYSDTLLIFLLKAHRPEKYRERYDVTTGGEKLEIVIRYADAGDSSS